MIMHILCSTDKNYIMPTGVMIKSVSANNKEADIVFHVIVDDTVDKKSQMQLCDVVKNNDKHVVEFLLFDDKTINTFPQIGNVKSTYITKATYYRLFVDRMLSNDIDKLLYLDSDIVVDKSLKALWDTNISNYAIGCVTDMSEAVQDYDRLGYDSKRGYFNAGVLLINLKYWREHHVTDSFIDIIINHPEKIRLHDQDILNICFCNSKIVLGIQYNLQHGFLLKSEYVEFDERRYRDNIDMAIQNPIIIHYTVAAKPWYIDCDHPLQYIWLKYAKQTRLKNYGKKRKYPFSIKNKIGNILRALHLRPQLSIEVSKYLL